MSHLDNREVLIPVRMMETRKAGGCKMTDSDPAIWRKSSYSGANSCVEVALIDGEVAVRDSKDRNGPVLSFTRAEWRAFLVAVCSGEFDLPG